MIVWGAGDQGRVNYPILVEQGFEIVAFVDDTPDLPAAFPQIPLLRGMGEFDPWLARSPRNGLGFVVAIGNPFGARRRELHCLLVGKGLSPVSFGHPSVMVSGSATIGEGVQMMPGAIVHVDARVGRQCILNTRSIVEHDCVLEDGVEIAPGAVLCGRVRIGRDSWIGAGSVVRPRINIGSGVIVGAGSVVVSDIADNAVVVGAPARPIRRRES